MDQRAGGFSSTRSRALLALAVLLVLLLATFAVWGFALGGLTTPLPGFELSVSAVEELIASWGCGRWPARSC